MKKITSFLVTLLVFASVAMAQPTLTSATNAPIAGDVFGLHLLDTTGLTKGVSGPSVTWDYSSVTSIYDDTIKFVACIGTPFCDSFPGSNLATPDGSGGYSYLSSTTNALSQLGYADASPYYEHYVNPYEVMYFPMVYNGSHLDTALLVSGSDSVRTIDSFFCDGWGTLRLPAQTYNNVLRIKMVSYDRDFTGVVTRYESYTWYTAGFHFPLLSITYDTVGSGTPYISDAEYFTRNTAATGNATLAAKEVSVFPNPANEVLHVTTPAFANATYTMVNCLGAVVLKGSLENTTTNISIGQLPTGMYTIRVLTGAEVIVKQFIKN